MALLLVAVYRYDGPKPSYPGDLTDLLVRRVSRSALYERLPWLGLLSTGLKYGPARDFLEETATNCLRRLPLRKRLQARELYDLLVTVAVQVAGLAGTALWAQWTFHHARNGSSRSSGPVLFLRKLGILVRGVQTKAWNPCSE